MVPPIYLVAHWVCCYTLSVLAVFGRFWLIFIGVTCHVAHSEFDIERLMKHETVNGTLCSIRYREAIQKCYNVLDYLQPSALNIPNTGSNSNVFNPNWIFCEVNGVFWEGHSTMAPFGQKKIKSAHSKK